MITETSSIFYWTVSRLIANLAITYQLTCDPLISEIPPHQVLVPAIKSSAVVNHFQPGTSYNCSIIFLGLLGTSEPKYDVVIIPEASKIKRPGGKKLILFPKIVPSGAPDKFLAVAGERKVDFSWSPPLVSLQNGVITNYTLSCFPSPSSLPQSLPQSGSLTVAGFSPNTGYSCSLVASNSQGSGPPAHVSFTTQKDRNTSIF